MNGHELTPERRIAEQTTLQEFCTLIDDLLLDAKGSPDVPVFGQRRTFEGGLFGVRLVVASKRVIGDEADTTEYRISFKEEFYDEDPLIDAKWYEYRVFKNNESYYQGEHETKIEVKPNYTVPNQNEIMHTHEIRNIEDVISELAAKARDESQERKKQIEAARNIGLLVMYEDEAQKAVQGARKLLEEGSVIGS